MAQLSPNISCREAPPATRDCTSTMVKYTTWLPVFGLSYYIYIYKHIYMISSTVPIVKDIKWPFVPNPPNSRSLNYGMHCLSLKYNTVTWALWRLKFTGQRWVPLTKDKGQWRCALMFSLICARRNCWVNNRDAGNLRRRRANYDVIVILRPWCIVCANPQRCSAVVQHYQEKKLKK